MHAEKTFSAGLWHSKSLFAKLVGLDSWIWPLFEKFGSITCIFKGQNLEATPPAISIVTFFTCCYWSTTSRKRRMYEIYIQDIRDIQDLYIRCIRFTKCTKSIKKYEIDRRYLSQYGFYNGAKSRQLARDLSFWCKRHWGTCIGSLTL